MLNEVSPPETATVAPQRHPSVSQLVPWEQYQTQVAHIFSTPEALRWHIRQHRAELDARGALCQLAGRLFVVPESFEAVTVEIGQRLAAMRAA